MTYAIFETGGKQYRAAQGDTLFIEKLDVEADASITFNRVLSVTDDGAVQFGTPFLEGASVTATVIKNGRGKKIRVFKMKSKKGYRRTQGHRQPYTKVTIDTITI
jgi:ribosomal protein L21